MQKTIDLCYLKLVPDRPMATELKDNRTGITAYSNKHAKDTKKR